MKPNSLAENLEIAFREEFSFQIYNSFSTNSNQNGLLLISSINTKFGGIFGDWKINFEDWRKERSFLILTSRSGLSGTDTQSIRVLQVKYVSNTYYMAAMCPHRPHTSAPSSITPGHPALSLSPSFIQHLSLYPKPWRGSHLSPTIKHLHLAGASPEDAGDRRR